MGHGVLESHRDDSCDTVAEWDDLCSLTENELKEFSENLASLHRSVKELRPFASVIRFQEDGTVSLFNSNLPTLLNKFKSVPIDDLLVLPIDSSGVLSKVIRLSCQSECVILTERDTITKKQIRGPLYQTTLTLLKQIDPFEIKSVPGQTTPSNISVTTKDVISLYFDRCVIPTSHLKHYFPFAHIV